MLGKGKQFFSYLKNQKASIFCLQETFSKKDDENYGLQNGVGKFFFLTAQSTPEVYVLWSIQIVYFKWNV